MKITNPWIDPRVQNVLPADAENYLFARGWRRMPFPREQVHLFAGPIADSGNPITQMVPADEQGDDYLQCIVDLITNLAKIEDRTATEVLVDMLAATTVNDGHDKDGNQASGKTIEKLAK